MKPSELELPLWTELKKLYDNSEAHEISRKIAPLVARFIETTNAPKIPPIDLEEGSRDEIIKIVTDQVKNTTSPEMRLKYLTELNKLQDNYSHGNQSKNITIELISYSDIINVPENTGDDYWVKIPVAKYQQLTSQQT